MWGVKGRGIVKGGGYNGGTRGGGGGEEGAEVPVTVIFDWVYPEAGSPQFP